MGQQQCQGNESEEKMSKVTFDFNGMKYAPAHPEHVITENLTACKYVDYDNAFCFCSTFGRTSGFIFVDAAKKLLGIVRHSVPVSHPDAVVDWGSTERINAPVIGDTSKVHEFDAPRTTRSTSVQLLAGEMLGSAVTFAYHEARKVMSHADASAYLQSITRKVVGLIDFPPCERGKPSTGNVNGNAVCGDCGKDGEG
jgi:hypothetical protein